MGVDWHANNAAANRHKAHDPDYRASLKDFQSYIEALTERIISADDTVPELPMKDVVCSELRSGFVDDS